MEVLELNGITYVKASLIARDLGYTSDYVGQLCRGGKVDAQLVGRSWYVNKESIRDHKQSRTRSTKAKSIKEVNRSLKEESDSVSRPASNSTLGSATITTTQPNFYRKIKPIESKYSEDQSELIPTLTERLGTVTPTRLSVELADAKKIKIKNQKKPYKMVSSERPKIRFTGNVTIVEPEDEKKEKEQTEPESKKEILEQPTLRKSTPTKSEKVHLRTVSKSSKSQKLKVAAADSASNLSAESIPLRRKPAVAMTRNSQRKVTGQSAQLVLRKIPSEEKRTGRATFVYITTSVFVAVILGVGIIFLEHSVTSSVGTPTLSSQYSFNLSAVFDAIKAYK